MFKNLKFFLFYPKIGSDYCVEVDIPVKFIKKLGKENV